MKRNILHSFWMVALPLLLASCSQEELPDMNGTSDLAPLSITVADGGYGASDGQTKAVENGYRTEFSAGDEAGLYIVRDGALVYDNVKLTAASGADGSLTWQPEAGTELGGGLDGETYYLCYPYRTDMSGKVDVTANDAEGFFAPLVSSWQPKADQSTYAAYSASDLMTAKGTATKGTDGSLKLSFSMSHRMAMAVIKMPPTVYKFTDAAIPDYIAASADFSSSAVKPCCIAPGTYRCIVNPAGSMATSITGSYDNGMKEFVVSPNGIAAGSCKTYRIAGLNPTEKSYSLQPGDYLCRNSGGGWYIIPKAEKPGSECIGIVFYAGHHPNDGSDYSGTGIGEKKCRGYAVAMEDATTGYCMWGVEGKELGCCPTDANGKKQNNYYYPDIDWCGYAWTQKIITAAGGKDKLNSSTPTGYPATYYAVEYYQSRVTAPAKSSGWFLPSIGQMSNIYQHSSFLSGSASLKLVLYWTSSENYFGLADYAITQGIRFGGVNISIKGYSCYVRPVLAF